MSNGWGRNAPREPDYLSTLRHRRIQLEAALKAARKHDQERATMERQLRDIDAAIGRGSGITEEEVQELERKLAHPLRRRSSK